MLVARVYWYWDDVCISMDNLDAMKALKGALIEAYDFRFVCETCAGHSPAKMVETRDGGEGEEYVSGDLHP
jgi:hypothetical protein